MNLELVSETWRQRKKSNLIKWLMQHSHLQLEEMADCLGCSTQYLNNKFNRDSFSIDDLIVAADASGYVVTLVPDQDGEAVSINFLNWFEDYDEETLARIARIKREHRESKYAEYEALKAEIDRMKQTYHFDD